jgi:RNA 3'-terminal phosphate cyclase (ATP)
MLATDGAIDPYLADQLLLPLALAPGSSCLRTTGISGHLLTNAWLIGHFLSAAINIDGVPGEPGMIRVSGLGR